MNLEEVKACLRGLLSSTAFSYNLNSLLNDFKNETGSDLPLFGHLHPIEFLKTLDDTVQLFGNPYNPEVALVNSKKSAHITSLVDRQKKTAVKNFRCLSRQRRLVVPETDLDEKENKLLLSKPCRIKVETKISQTASCSDVNPYMPNQSPPKTVFSVTQPQHSFFTKIPYDQMQESQDSPRSTLGKTNSGPTYKVQDEKSFEVGKSNSSYFEDVSDSESCVSMEDFRNSNRVSRCFINSGIKKKLSKLIRDSPEGLWCCNLPKLFEKKYNFALDFREYGYTSLIQMLSELPDVFRCVRPGNDDWLLFDASVAPSPEEKKMMDLQATADINCEIAANVKKLLFNVFENTCNSRLDLDSISEMYKKIYCSCLDFHSLGFRDLKSFLKTWEGSLFSMVDCDGKTFLVPTLKNTAQPSIHWEEALPPITAENDIFIEIFPKEVVGPGESLVELDLARHVAVGNMINVTIAEVWSPSQFYMQLNKFKTHLNLFMDELQKFYNVHLKKYKMPDSTIRPQQICVGLYTPDPETPDEWHRAQIIKVVNEKIVLVNFVDYGTETRVKKTHLRFLHRDFQSFPVQGLLAQLSGVEPADGTDNWPISTSKRFLELVQVPSLNAEIVDIDFKKPRMSVVLLDPSDKSGPSINKRLVLEKLACWWEPISCIPAKKEPEIRTEETLEPAEGSVQETFNSNLAEITYEFSDISDLGQPTLFHFKMKSLKLEDSLPPTKSRSEEINSIENLNYEFDDVPDLDVKVETETKKENAAPEEISTSVLPPQSSTAPSTESQNFSPSPEPTSSNQQLLEVPQLPISPECSLVPFPGKLKRLPPGLEHANPVVDFEQIQLMSPPNDLKKKINILAMQLLTTNSSIKQVGMDDPVLAVKIATEMAEACITSKYTPSLPAQFDPLLMSLLQLWSAMGPNLSSERPSEGANPPPGTNNSFSSQPRTESSPLKSEKEQEYVKEIQADGKTLHLVTINHELYFCAEQIIRSFSTLPNREVADRVLHMKKIHIDYRIITKATDEKVLNAIKSSQLPVIKNKSKKLKIYLIPIRKVIPVLQGLGYNAKHLESFFQELQLSETKKTQGKTENSEVS